MRPFHAILDEAFDELRRGDRSSVTGPDVSSILAIGRRSSCRRRLIGKRTAYRRTLAGSDHLVGQRIVIGEQSAMLITERIPRIAPVSVARSTNVFTLWVPVPK